MSPYLSHLQSITHGAGDLLRLLENWVCINSQTYNRPGLDQMLRALEMGFTPLGGYRESLRLTPRYVMDPEGREKEREFGRVLRIIKRPESPHRVLLCGHMDTVLTPDRARVGPEGSKGERLFGIGATDAKGGLAVMLAGLQAFESSPFASGLGWEVLIVSDEEIGSHGSRTFLLEAAGRCGIGLLFEPALPDGSLVGERPGSANYTAVIHGRSAHAGRDPGVGRNAIEALADFIVSLRSLAWGKGILINVGAVEGGGPVNVVPDLAMCRFNVRVPTYEDMEKIREGVDGIAREIGGREGISVDITGGFGRPPKPLAPGILYLLEHVASCGRDLGLFIRWSPSGGVCDGNTLYSAGLPNVDSLGPVGDGLHTPEEYVIKESVVERAKLTALFLMKLASQEIRWPPH